MDIEPTRVRIEVGGIVRFKVYDKKNNYIGSYHVSHNFNHVDVYFTDEIAECTSIMKLISYNYRSGSKVALEEDGFMRAPDESQL